MPGPDPAGDGVGGPVSAAPFQPGIRGFPHRVPEGSDPGAGLCQKHWADLDGGLHDGSVQIGDGCHRGGPDCDQMPQTGL